MPTMLDLFCGEGGATKGYMDAGWTVDGVDLANKGKRYPGRKFIQADALEFLRKGLHKGYDFIHASPPCQAYTIATAGNPAARGKHVRMIAEVRELLVDSGIPYVIENVEQARAHMLSPILLCGRQFSLTADDTDGHPLVLDRHRLFESNVPLFAPDHPPHDTKLQVAGAYGGSRRSSKPNATPADDRYAARYERKGGYVPRSTRVIQELLGIDWMTKAGMYQSIPPAYAEYIGRQVIEQGTKN